MKVKIRWKRRKARGSFPQAIADKYIDIFEQDTRDLNILEPTHKPRATEYIAKMIEMVGQLIKNKHAYVTEHAVYFDVSTFPRYNDLNHQKIDFNQKVWGKELLTILQKNTLPILYCGFSKRCTQKCSANMAFSLG